MIRPPEQPFDWGVRRSVDPVLMQLLNRLMAIRQARQQIAIQGLINPPRFSNASQPFRPSFPVFNPVQVPQAPVRTQPVVAPPVTANQPASSTEPVSSYSPPGYMNPGLWNWIISGGFHESANPDTGLKASGTPLAF